MLNAPMHHAELTSALSQLRDIRAELDNVWHKVRGVLEPEELNAIELPPVSKAPATTSLLAHLTTAVAALEATDLDLEQATTILKENFL